MNTEKQLPSGIDDFAAFSLPEGENTLINMSEEFWRMACNTTNETYNRHKLYRLQWPGDWLAVQQGLKNINKNVAPLNILHSYLIIRDNRSAADVAAMTATEMEQALAAELEAYASTPGAQDVLRNAERRLDKWMTRSRVKADSSACSGHHTCPLSPVPTGICITKTVISPPLFFDVCRKHHMKKAGHAADDAGVPAKERHHSRSTAPARSHDSPSPTAGCPGLQHHQTEHRNNHTRHILSGCDLSET